MGSEMCIRYGDGGADGLDVLRRVARGSGSWLAPDGLLLVEGRGELFVRDLDEGCILGTAGGACGLQWRDIWCGRSIAINGLQLGCMIRE